MNQKSVKEDHEEEAPSDRPSQKGRDAPDLLGAKDSDCRKWLEKKINAIVRGFEEQASRSDNLDQWWRIYNCELDDNQFYNGNAQVYIPIIRDAVNARATRHANQLCPQTGRYVDVSSSDGHLPWEIIALVDHYLRPDPDYPGFKTSILYPLLINGDIEGQYNVYVDWDEIERQIVSRETRPLEVDGMPVPEEMAEPEIEKIEEEVVEGRPNFEVLHDCDVLVIPVTSNSLMRALRSGGSATIVRRWSKDKYEAMEEEGEIEGLARDGNDEIMTMTEDNLTGLQDLPKKLASDMGIRAPSRSVVMFETWLMVPLDDDSEFDEKKGKHRLCRLWWNLNREAEGLARNPYWNDRCPLLTSAVQKKAGVIKGKSLVEPLAPLQYEANDAANERADVDHYGSMPIIMRKPGMGNAPLILNLAAVWDADPNDIKFAEFPDLSARGRARIMDAMQIINTSLGINPSMLPQTGRPGVKRNQAEVALEQSVDLLTVAEAVEVPDQNILTPLVSWMVDLDHQFRDRDLTVRAFGEMGLKAKTIPVPPLQNRSHYNFTWCGAQQVKQNVAMMQQGTAAIDMARGMVDIVKKEGYELRVGPLFERLFSAIFGGELGSQSLVDMRHQMSVDPELENQMLADGFLVPVHTFDDVTKHLQSHMQAKQMMGDPHSTLAVHIQEHLMQQAAQNAAQVAQMAGGQGGAGGAGAGGPSPQPGAQPTQPRQMKGPPGMIAPERMPAAGGTVPPRRF